MSRKKLKPFKPNGRVIILIWSITAFLTLAYGWSIFDKLSYASKSVEVTGSVNKKTSHRSRTGNSRNYSTAYNIIYQFENPDVDGKMELKSELAPLMYALLDEGDSIKIYFNNTEKPNARISYPIHYWMMSIIWGICLFLLLLICKYLSNHNQRTTQQYRNFKMSLLVALLAPGFFGTAQNLIENQVITSEREAERHWPRWEALERAVSKPSWWDTVPIKYFDPMDYTSEEYSAYLKANTGADKRHRQFKVAYAFLLLHQDDPLQMGWDLAKGTTREFMPLYEFFLEHHMYQEWQGQCSNPCSDATQMVEMAGDLLSMKLDENQIDYSRELIQDIMKYKYSRGNNRGKYYFLYSYRRFLEHTESVEKAHEILDNMVEENLIEAQSLGLKTQIRKWSNFWKSNQRKVGMFSAQPSR